MKKEDVKRVKKIIDQISGENYRKTFVSYTGTLHIRIGTYAKGWFDDVEKLKKCVDCLEAERNDIINKLKDMFPEYDIQKNNKRYQGFLNDICITVK